MNTADEKIAKVSRSFRKLARELRDAGDMQAAAVAADLAETLPDSSALRLHKILTEKSEH